MDDLEGAVPEVDPVAIGERGRGGRGGYAVGGGSPSGWPALEHLIGGISIGERPFPARVGQDLSFRPLDATIVELVMGADVIEMGVAGDTDDRPDRHQRDVAPKADMAEA